MDRPERPVWRYEFSRRIFIIIAIVAPTLLGLGLLIYQIFMAPYERFLSPDLVRTRLLTSLALLGAGVAGFLMRYLSGGFASSAAAQSKGQDLQFEVVLDRLRQAEASSLTRLRKFEADLDKIKNELVVIAKSNVREDLADEQRRGLVEDLKQQIRQLATAEILDEIRLESRQYSTRSSQIDALQENFRQALHRLEREIAALTRRGNLNLVLGILSTAAGLGVLTFVVFQAGPPKDLTNVLFYYLPRLALVIFIEIFAYFFLRLYKQTLDETKYFQNELTNVEARFTAARLCLEESSQELKYLVISEMAKTERNFILEKGQTTVDLAKRNIDSESVLAVHEAASKLLQLTRDQNGG